MAQVVGVGSAKSAAQTIHDPTCGSGSLLLKAHDEAKQRTGFDLALYAESCTEAQPLKGSSTPRLSVRRSS